MTKRTQRKLRGVYAPKQAPVFKNEAQRYDQHPLEIARADIQPRYHRDASADDRYNDPRRSETVRALLLWIAAAQHHALLPMGDLGMDFDLQVFCADAELTERQTEVVLLVALGHGLSDIAELLGVHHSTISQHLLYGRRKLAGRLPLLVAI